MCGGRGVQFGGVGGGGWAVIEKGGPATTPCRQ